MSVRRSKRWRTYRGRRKVKLEVTAKNFGPITRAKIELKPLTIFIGPNNSGKSYAAMLVHAIMESFVPFSARIGYPISYLSRKVFRELFGPNAASFERDFYRLHEQILALKLQEELEVPSRIIDLTCHRIFEAIYERTLRDEIVRSFACPLRELVKMGRRSFSLRIVFDSYGTSLTYKRRRLKITECPKLDIKITIKANEKMRFGAWRVSTLRKKTQIQIGTRPAHEQTKIETEYKRFMRDRLLREIPSLIAEICVSSILGNVARPCYYLPAARSGILQGHKALAASIVRKAPSVGIERIEIPKFSGVVADFISSVIDLPQEESPFYKLALDFERELIKGEIVVRTLDEFLYPEIKYRFEKTEIPLHRSSSTVSELAPLFLYLKYSIGPGSILIIEEPEAHLHPENQRILAKFLVRLIRKDVIVAITTHSEYLLEQLNSFILLDKVEPEKRVERYGYGKEDFLKSQEVATYVFAYDKKSGGHKTSTVKITEEDGISEQEFLRIHEALYEETFKLRRDLGAKA